MTKFPIVEPEVNDYLKSLSKEEIHEVINHFHGRKLKINQIIEMYKLEKISISTFVKTLPPVQHHDLICPECKVVSWKNHLARNSKSVPFCPKCGEDLICYFNSIEYQRKMEFLKERELWQQKMDPDYYEQEISVTKEKFETLSLFQKVFLGSIVQAIVEDDLFTIKGKLLKEFKLFPIPEELNEQLIELGITEGDDFTEYKYNIEKDVTKELLNCDNKLGSTLKQQLELWHVIAKAESKEYLIGEMEYSNFRYHHDNKFEEVFSILFQNHSVAQTFHLINKSVADACKLYAQRGNRYLSENSVIGACARMADYYPTRGWPILNYERRKYHQSLMSQYFFNRLLKIGNRGFYNTPTLELLLHNNFNIIE
ncbi:hypothetical protein [Plebeiibacterium sediminum]|uniref:Uncharacterized protein n=1 Tax=Plebeiibacterium sediminum TaxID=2992112 RepID=A0AAE3M5K1_9BACT|nr:hypothetical protein [Plebeiobacterium sediminum]MCW3787235.1 hypothetical protein [Plebeiobacterium sediminum]